jgi:protein-S-isoprenylcysteine O-methyltransferase Ste14
MALRENFEKSGNWLFRWRSFLPLIILPILFIALPDSEYLDRAAGKLAGFCWEVFCVAVSFTGLYIRCLVAGYAPRRTSGRNTKEQKAEIINTTGMYSVMRHPLYFGNFLIFLGMVLFTQVVWFILFSILAFWLYYERIMFAEEEFLRKKFGDRYLKYTEEIPAFIPLIHKWRQPALSFSYKTVLKREYTAIFIIIASFTFLDIFADLLSEGKFSIDLVWIISIALVSAIYAIIKTLKKRTRILHVEGR